MTSAWKIEFSPAALKAIRQLDRTAAERILLYLETRVLPSGNPRSLGRPLSDSRPGDLWRYRVGDYRVVADLRDSILVVLVVRIAHRRRAYR